MDDQLRDLQYYLLSPRRPLPEQVDLHNQVYDFWLSVWKPTLKGLGYSDALLQEDFMRQDLVSCICYKDQVVGVILYSFLNLDAKAVMEFRYMKNNYPESYVHKIRKMGVRSVVSMHYLAIHPDWTGRKNPLAPISSLIAGFANKVRDHYGLDAVIGVMRRDFKIADPYYARGADCIIACVPSHNVDCDLIASIRGRTYEHPDLKISELENYLWKNRIDSDREKASSLVPLRQVG